MLLRQMFFAVNVFAVDVFAVGVFAVDVFCSRHFCGSRFVIEEALSPPVLQGAPRGRTFARVGIRQICDRNTHESSASETLCSGMIAIRSGHMIMFRWKSSSACIIPR